MKSYLIFYFTYWPIFILILAGKLGYLSKLILLIRGLLGWRKFLKVTIAGFHVPNRNGLKFFSLDEVEASWYRYALNTRRNYELIVEDVSSEDELKDEFYPMYRFIPVKSNGQIDQNFCQKIGTNRVFRVAAENIVLIEPTKVKLF